MGSVNSMLLWSIADSLGIEITYDRALQRIRGEGTLPVDFFGLPVNFHTRVVSSQVNTNGSVLLLVRVKGNFCLLLHGETQKKNDMITVRFLNLAKLDGKIEGWLEATQPKNTDICERLLKPALGKSFQRIGRTWREIKE